MLRMYAAAMAAALVTPAFAVPAAPGLSYEHTLVLASPLSSDGYGAVETELSALMSQSNGVATTASIAGPSGNRRLQSGSSLTITYVVACGSSCDAVADVRCYSASPRSPPFRPTGKTALNMRLALCRPWPPPPLIRPSHRALSPRSTPLLHRPASATLSSAPLPT